MPSVWYVGTADVRAIYSRDWSLVGIIAADTRWDSYNGWSVSQSLLTAPQIAILDANNDFQLTATDGARPGSVVVPDVDATLSKSDTLELIESGIASSLSGKVSKGSLIVDVRDHGAIGNGTTDDTAAITAAIASAVSTGIRTVGLAGPHAVTATILVPAGIHLTSISGTSEIRPPAGFNFPVIKVDGVRAHLSNFTVRKVAGAAAGENGFGIMVVGASDGAILEKLTVDGASAGFYSAGHLGTTPDTVRRLAISHCRAMNSNVFGFEIDETDGLQLSHCTSTVSGLDGVKLRRKTKNSVLVGGYFTGATGGDGLDAYAGGDTFSITGGVYSGNSINGITIKSDTLQDTEELVYGYVRNATLANVIACDNGGNGVTFHRGAGSPDDPTVPLASHLSVSGGIFHRNTNYGMYLLGRQITVVGVSCSDNGLDGIYLEPACSDVTLLGCNVSGNSVTTPGGRDGIRLAGSRIKVVGGSSIGASSAEARTEAELAAATRKQRYGVQIAATATRVDISGLSTEYNLTGDISDLSGLLLDPQFSTRHLTTGRYIIPEGVRSSLLMNATSEYAVPIWIGNRGTIIRAGIEITIAGTTGTVIRLGLRSVSDVLPGAVIGASATVAGDVISGGVEAVVSWPVTPGLYFLTATAQSTGATLPTVRATSASPPGVSFGVLSTALGAATLGGYIGSAAVTGELPAAFVISNRSAAPPLIAIRS